MPGEGGVRVPSGGEATHLVLQEDPWGDVCRNLRGEGGASISPGLAVCVWCHPHPHPRYSSGVLACSPRAQVMARLQCPGSTQVHMSRVAGPQAWTSGYPLDARVPELHQEQHKLGMSTPFSFPRLQCVWTPRPARGVP